MASWRKEELSSTAHGIQAYSGGSQKNSSDRHWTPSKIDLNRFIHFSTGPLGVGFLCSSRLCLLHSSDIDDPQKNSEANPWIGTLGNAFAKMNGFSCWAFKAFRLHSDLNVLAVRCRDLPTWVFIYKKNTTQNIQSISLIRRLFAGWIVYYHPPIWYLLNGLHSIWFALHAADDRSAGPPDLICKCLNIEAIWIFLRSKSLRCDSIGPRGNIPFTCSAWNWIQFVGGLVWMNGKSHGGFYNNLAFRAVAKIIKWRV